MTDSEDKEQPIPFLVYDSNTKSNFIHLIFQSLFNLFI